MILELRKDLLGNMCSLVLVDFTAFTHFAKASGKSERHEDKGLKMEAWCCCPYSTSWQKQVLFLPVFDFQHPRWVAHTPVTQAPGAFDLSDFHGHLYWRAHTHRQVHINKSKHIRFKEMHRSLKASDVSPEGGLLHSVVSTCYMGPKQWETKNFKHMWQHSVNVVITC